MVEEIKHGQETFTYVRGCSNPKALTILIKGGTGHVIDEIERAIKDGLGDVICSLKSGLVVPGGGAIEIELAKRLREFSHGLSGREQLAVEEFASALEFIPSTLAENAGMDPGLELARVLEVKENMGVDVIDGQIKDLVKAGVIDPVKVTRTALQNAASVAIMVATTNVLITDAPEKEKAPVPGGMPGMGDF